jgi:hypothetical protein
MSSVKSAMDEKKAIESKLEWAGLLTVENAEWIADRMRSLLIGRSYVSVSASEHAWPSVMTGQMLHQTNPILVFRNRICDRDVALIQLYDSHGVWQFPSSQSSVDDVDNTAMSFNFEHRKMSVAFRRDGLNVHWVFACEGTPS